MTFVQYLWFYSQKITRKTSPVEIIKLQDDFVIVPQLLDKFSVNSKMSFVQLFIKLVPQIIWLLYVNVCMIIGKEVVAYTIIVEEMFKLNLHN